MQQRVADGETHIACDIALCFNRTGAEMRGEHEIGRAAQRVIRGEWLRGVHVQHSAAQLFGLERREERRFIDNAAARHVDGHRARRQAPELSLADHAARFIRKRRVYGEHIGFGQQRIERCGALHAQRRESFISDVRIKRHDTHTKRMRARCDFTTDPPQSDDAQRLPFELSSEIQRAVPSTLGHCLRRLRELAQQPDDGTKKQLGDRHRVAGRRVDDSNTK